MLSSAEQWNRCNLHQQQFSFSFACWPFKLLWIISWNELNKYQTLISINFGGTTAFLCVCRVKWAKMIYTACSSELIKCMCLVKCINAICFCSGHYSQRSIESYARNHIQRAITTRARTQTHATMLRPQFNIFV